jgi:hypothetical protein
MSYLKFYNAAAAVTPASLLTTAKFETENSSSPPSKQQWSDFDYQSMIEQTIEKEILNDTSSDENAQEEDFSLSSETELLDDLTAATDIGSSLLDRKRNQRLSIFSEITNKPEKPFAIQLVSCAHE